MILALAVVAVVVLVWRPWQRTPPMVPEGLPPDAFSGPAPPEGAPPVVLAAGDIGECGGNADATARLLREHDGVVAAVGDLAYPDGSVEAFAECYAPTWGTERERTRPALGNHDVITEDAAGYFDFFGALAGPDPVGYYSYDLGEWHVVVLNSNCTQAGGCDAGSAQYRWLRDDLAGTSTGNILAYWHHPRYSSGRHGDTPGVDPFWDLLAEAGADVVLSAHDHDYQRFTVLDGDGEPAPAGLRQFVVGTGGAELRGYGDDSELVQFRQSSQHGILRLELGSCDYRWSFLAADGGPPLDEGITDGTC